jgi:DNA-directed RNA polymerase sigma subunit (sigma70/sigma32)
MKQPDKHRIRNTAVRAFVQENFPSLTVEEIVLIVEDMARRGVLWRKTSTCSRLPKNQINYRAACIFKMRLTEGKTRNEIAAKYDLSIERVRQIEHKLIAIMNKALRAYLLIQNIPVIEKTK